ncbi:hypothetical protein CHGG_02657 [Chaetomium globosum CBS 148.51]|uniref:Uncharacterized protein n=1 Tax=Chaetomium globosum (strain ATCC 6205 / CBS 148.51 / DSM 1962 / NBRC 6347 / NRRL 1970) TaxID=306901 RepID=Q2HAU7_CHAGB|nr:uncharacterized protein CHGG_02657 [Chaetomium globosum CBS 148.51]EAQ90722.1 hypothetical protein CHGG_02657 [Chaetomium globosum CBS 148.51]
MTRTAVYSTALVALVAATVMTITSIVSPNWVSLSVPSPSGGTVTDTIGLHRRCASSTGSCAPFPEPSRCDGSDGGTGRSFCSMWRTTGFLMSFAVVAELATLVGFLVILAGGRVKREGGWKVSGGGCWLRWRRRSFWAYLFDHDDLFLVPGYRLDSSWYLCTASASAALLAGVGLAISALVLPPEDGYSQLLNDSNGV